VVIFSRFQMSYSNVKFQVGKKKHKQNLYIFNFQFSLYYIVILLLFERY